MEAQETLVPQKGLCGIMPQFGTLGESVDIAYINPWEGILTALKS